MEELLAKGFITITDVSDGYTVSLSTPSVSITANYDGSNPDLSNANTQILVSKGNDYLNFEITGVICNPADATYTVGRISTNKWMVLLTSIPASTISGFLQINIRVEDGFETFVRFNFSVVRNLQGIRWIEEWDGTGTEIGDSYVITPKIFAGTKNQGILDGIYLGDRGSIPINNYPFGESPNYIGLYGINKGSVDFCIDNNGGFIGGWYITHDAIYNGVINNTNKNHTSESGSITIGTNGIRGYRWRLESDGSGDIAGGNISWDANGNVTFADAVSLSWSNISGAVGNKLTKIDANGIYTGTITAEQMNAAKCNFTQGKIGGIEISKTFIAAFDTPEIGTLKQPVWELNSDGSGGLAKYKIKWDALGNLTLDPSITLKWGDKQEGTIGSVLSYDTASGAIKYTGAISAEQMNAAECNFTQGKIGGIEIDGDQGIKAVKYTAGEYGPVGKLLWALWSNGSGYLGECISWAIDGSGRIGDPVDGISWKKDGTVDISSGVNLKRDVNPGTFGNILKNLDAEGVYSGPIGADVSISSNKPIVAPSVIEKRIRTININNGGVLSLPLNLDNCFILVNKTFKTGVNVTLPPPQTIAEIFGTAVFPINFGIRFTLAVPLGGYSVNLDKIQMANGQIGSLVLDPGSSVTFMFFINSNGLGPVYQIINIYK